MAAIKSRLEIEKEREREERRKGPNGDFVGEEPKLSRIPEWLTITFEKRKVTRGENK